MPIFQVGISPDFYVDAKGHFEAALDRKLGSQPGIEYAPMPPQPDNTATPEALNQFDAILSLAMKITAESLRGVDRATCVMTCLPGPPCWPDPPDATPTGSAAATPA